jgi:hypothetical protein
MEANEMTTTFSDLIKDQDPFVLIIEPFNILVWNFPIFHINGENV